MGAGPVIASRTPSAWALAVRPGVAGMKARGSSWLVAGIAATVATRVAERRALPNVTSIRFSPGDRSRAVIRAVIGLGQSLGVTITAEGIEHELVANYLRDEGCAQGQGYLFGRAQPACELTMQHSMAWPAWERRAG